MMAALNRPDLASPTSPERLAWYAQFKQRQAEELGGYYIVKAILGETVDVKRIVMRDVQSYCGILLDDNNRKPICRLHFNTNQKYVSFFDDQKEARVSIGGLDDLYKYADRLKATVTRYETKGATHKALA